VQISSFKQIKQVKFLHVFTVENNFTRMSDHEQHKYLPTYNKYIYKHKSILKLHTLL
jgi:hypothetical protein